MKFSIYPLAYSTNFQISFTKIAALFLIFALFPTIEFSSLQLYHEYTRLRCIVDPRRLAQSQASRICCRLISRVRYIDASKITFLFLRRQEHYRLSCHFILYRISGPYYVYGIRMRCKQILHIVNCHQAPRSAVLWEADTCAGLSRWIVRQNDRFKIFPFD